MKHGRIEITDNKSKKVLARGLPLTMRTYADGFCTVGLMISDELVCGIEAASEIDIRLNGMVIVSKQELRAGAYTSSIDMRSHRSGTK